MITANPLFVSYWEGFQDPDVLYRFNGIRSSRKKLQKQEPRAKKRKKRLFPFSQLPGCSGINLSSHAVSNSASESVSQAPVSRRSCTFTNASTKASVGDLVATHGNPTRRERATVSETGKSESCTPQSFAQWFPSNETIFPGRVTKPSTAT